MRGLDFPEFLKERPGVLSVAAIGKKVSDNILSPTVGAILEYFRRHFVPCPRKTI